MKYVFLDESGELGFSNKSSKFFTITLLVCGVKEEQELSRILKKIRLRILKKSLKQSPEIKWNNSNDLIRFKILERVLKIEFEIFSIILDKSKVYDYLKNKKHKLYNYLTNLIMNECSLNDSFELIVDRSKNNRSLRDDFNRYIKSNVTKSDKIIIKHEDSNSNGTLQVLDFVSGAIFNKYEFNNNSYYNIIKEKIILEKLFP